MGRPREAARVGAAEYAWLGATVVNAAGAGAVRGATGDYFLAFVTSGLACLLASLLVLRVTRSEPALAPAE